MDFVKIFAYEISYMSIQHAYWVAHIHLQLVSSYNKYIQ